MSLPPPVGSINPIAATPDPEYKSYQWSRAISPIEGNKAGEIAIKGAANTLTEGVSATDTLIKNSLTNSIEDSAGAKRDQYSNELGDTLAVLKGAKSSADAGTDATGKMNLLSTDNKTEIPKDLKGLESEVTKLEAMKANGKQTQSQYLANINSLAKQYRVAWPGYREFIDDTFDRVTQRGPANRLIQSRVAELDSYAAMAAATKNRDKALLQHAQEVDHIPQSNQWEVDYDAGRLSGPGLRSKYNGVMSVEFNHKRELEDWASQKIGTEKKMMAAEKVVNSKISNTIDSFVDTMGDTVGYNLDKINSDIASGNPEMKGHAEELATRIKAFRDQAIAAATKEAMEVRNGSSVYRDLGDPKKFNELINDHPKIKALDATVALLNSKDYGLATVSLRLQHEAVNNATWKLVSENTDMSKALFGMLVSKNLGDAANSKILQDTLGKGGALENYPMWFQKYNIFGATQPNQDDPKVPDADKYITLNHAIKEAQANKVNDPVSFTRLFNTTVQNITDPKTPDRLKENYMNFAFAPANLGILESINTDHRDPATGKPIPGKVWLYNQLTNEGVAKEVARLSSRNPTLYKNFQDFVSQEGQHIAGQEVPKLNSLFDNPYVKVSYDNVNHQFKISETGFKPDYKSPRARVPGEIGQGATNLLKKIEAYKMFSSRGDSRLAGQDAVDKINSVLAAVGTMAQYAPGKPDPNEYALTLLDAISPPGSVGEKMVKAIMSTAPKPKEPTK